MILSEISAKRPFGWRGAFLWYAAKGFFQLVCCFAAALILQEVTGAPHGALFNAYAFV